MKTFEAWCNEGLGTAIVNATVGKPLRDIKIMKDYLEKAFVEDDEGNRYAVPKTGLRQGYQWYYNKATRKVDQRKINQTINNERD